MASGATKTMLLSLVMAALAVAAAQAAVTIYNPVGLVFDILVGDKDVKVATDMVTLNLSQEQQDIHFKAADGEVMNVNVLDGDVIVLIPDPSDDRNLLTFKAQVNGEGLTPLQPSDPSVAPPRPDVFPRRP